MDNAKRFDNGTKVSNSNGELKFSIQFFFNMYHFRSIFLFLLVGISFVAAAQPLRFGSGIFAGANLSQVDGDDMQGYDKPGFDLGLRCMTYILPKFEFHTELAYNQRGSQSKGYGKLNDKGRRLNLDYVSINALIVVNDWFHPIKEYYRLQIHGGVSTGRLVRNQVNDPSNQVGRVSLDELSTYFNSTDFSMIFGGHIKVTEKTGLTFRYARNMNKLLNADLVQPMFERKTISSMKGYFVSCDIFYNF